MARRPAERLADPSHARKRGECFFAALVDPEGKAALAPLYNEKKT